MATPTEVPHLPRSGLKFHRPAETLIKANAVAAVVFLLSAACAALASR